MSSTDLEPCSTPALRQLAAAGGGGVLLGAHQCGLSRLAPRRGGGAKGRLAELDFFSA